MTSHIRQAVPAGAVPVSDPAFPERVRAPKLRTFARRWSPDVGSVLILGASGDGKTMAMGSLVLRALAELEESTSEPRNHWLPSAVWASGPSLARARRETRFGASCEAMNDARTAGVLLLDEIGGEGGDAAWLLELADWRYSRGLVTVTTSGLPRHELEARYGTAAIRRLIEPKGTTLSLFPAPTPEAQR